MVPFSLFWFKVAFLSKLPTKRVPLLEDGSWATKEAPCPESLLLDPKLYTMAPKHCELDIPKYQGVWPHCRDFRFFFLFFKGFGFVRKHDLRPSFSDPELRTSSLFGSYMVPIFHMRMYRAASTAPISDQDRSRFCGGAPHTH